MSDETREAERSLRRRVWQLRPALAMAVKCLREVYPEYEDIHDGAEIMCAIDIGEQALAETAGPVGAQQPDARDEELARLRKALCYARDRLEDIGSSLVPIPDGDELRVMARVALAEITAMLDANDD